MSSSTMLSGSFTMELKNPASIPSIPCQEGHLDRKRDHPMLAINRRQVPLMPAFAITAHTSQGKMLPAVLQCCSTSTWTSAWTAALARLLVAGCAAKKTCWSSGLSLYGYFKGGQRKARHWLGHIQGQHHAGCQLTVKADPELRVVVLDVKTQGFETEVESARLHSPSASWAPCCRGAVPNVRDQHGEARWTECHCNAGLFKWPWPSCSSAKNQGIGVQFWKWRFVVCFSFQIRISAASMCNKTFNV